VLQAVAIKAGILLLLVSVLGSLGLLPFGKIRPSSRTPA